MQDYSVKVVFASDYEQLSAALSVLKEISETLQKIASYSQSIEKARSAVIPTPSASSSISSDLAKAAARSAEEIANIESAANKAKKSVSSLASEIGRLEKSGGANLEELKAQLGERFGEIEQEAVRRLVSRGMMGSITENDVENEVRKIAQEMGIVSAEAEQAKDSIDGFSESIKYSAKIAKDIGLETNKAKNEIGDLSRTAAEAGVSEVERIAQNMKTVSDEAARAENSIDGFSKTIKASAQNAKEAEDGMNNMVKAAAKSKELGREMSRLGKVASAVSMAGYLLSDAINTAARYLTIIGGISLAPLIKSAYDFAREFSVVNEISREWNENTQRIHDAYIRIGESAAKVFLPVIRLVASFSEKIAEFAERNPAAVAAVAAVGGLAISVATLLKLISGGIRIAFDLVYVNAVSMWISSQLLAAKAIESASGKMLAAASVLSSSSARGAVATTVGTLLGSKSILEFGSSIMRAIAAVSLFTGKVILIALAFEAARRAINFVMRMVNPSRKDTTWGDIWTTVRQIGALALYPYQKLMLKDSKEAWERAKRLMGFAVKETVENTYTLSEAIRGLGIDINSLLRDFEKMRNAEKNILSKMNQDIARENENANRKVEEENKRHADEIAKINQDSAEAIRRIQSDFNSDIARMAYEYAAQRVKIIEDSNRQIEEAERDHQNRLYELKQEHIRRVAEIEDERDALALVRENQRYQDEVEKENRRFGEIVERERRETALRLQELEARYAQERAMRIAEYQRQLAEENAQRQRKIAEEQQRHVQELQEIAKQREERIAEIRRGAQMEIQQLRQEFVDRLKMEIEAKQAEKGLRQQYYNAMLADLEAFLRQYRISLSSLTSGNGNVQVHDYTGYAYPGLYRFNEMEFVLDNRTTREMERIIGGRITGERILSGMRGNATFYFHFSNVTAADRDIIARQAMEATLSALNRVM